MRAEHPEQDNYGDDLLEEYVEPEALSSTFIVDQTKLAALGYLLIYTAMTWTYFARSHVHKCSHVCMVSTPIVMLAVLYGINCAVKGHCNTFAWLVSYFFLVTGTLAIIYVFSR